MRIAIVTETFLPNVNGVVTRLCHALEDLTRMGDEVLLVTPDEGLREYGGARIHPVRGLPLPLYPEVRLAPPRPTVTWALDAFRPDVVHAVNPALLGWNAVRYARSRHVPLLCSFHTYLPRYLHHYHLGAMEPLAWELLRTVHNQAARTLCLSHAVESDLHSHGFERLRIGWRGGVAIDRFDPSHRSAEMRHRLSGGHPERPLLLYVGRLSAEKSVERLAPMLRELPGCSLALVGEGPHRGTLEQELAGLPATFAGCLTGQDLVAAYASADLFVFPSETETLGLVLLEAMASGCPVIAARAGGIPEIVEHGVNGVLCEPGRPEAMAAEVRGLLEDRDRTARLRNAGLETAQDWSWPAAAVNLRSHYIELLGAEVRAA
ncbi:MAG TPA: glycosyltransferase family 1 protein [Candidatus Dormibacteraeota bacterium]|jgi:glycosyltransferase involved in cell wall biosynthesis|nr:glycosyltransferase family 1 protein [Candidatus Dormibacteraeota bacterium]